MSIDKSQDRVSTVLTIGIFLTFLTIFVQNSWHSVDFLATVHALMAKKKREMFSSLNMCYFASFLFARVIKLCGLKKP